MEAGCGSGGVCFRLEDLGVKSLGIDIVPNIVKDAYLFAKTISSEAQFIIGDITCLPLRSKSLDGVISLGVVEHFRLTDETFQAFKETYRVLKDNGKALFTVPNLFVSVRNKFLLFFSKGHVGMYHRFYTVRHLTRLAKSSGFSSYHADVVDLWLPVFFVIDGLLKTLGIDKKMRRKIYHYFMKLPHIHILEALLGHILLTVSKRDGSQRSMC